MFTTVTLSSTTNPTEKIEFSTLPQEIPESGSAETREFPVVGLGKHSRPWGREERRFNLQGTFTGWVRYNSPAFRSNTNYINRGIWRSPQELTNQIRNWCDAGARLKYEFFGISGAISITAYIAGYDFTRRGHAGDINYSIKLVEWRSLSIRIDDGSSSASTVSDNPADTETQEDSEPTPTTYTVQPGDTLSLIAKRLLEDSGRWQELLDLNRDVIGSNPNLIQPGMELTIPGGTVPTED